MYQNFEAGCQTNFKRLSNFRDRCTTPAENHRYIWHGVHRSKISYTNEMDSPAFQGLSFHEARKNGRRTVTVAREFGIPISLSHRNREIIPPNEDIFRISSSIFNTVVILVPEHFSHIHV